MVYKFISNIPSLQMRQVAALAFISACALVIFMSGAGVAYTITKAEDKEHAAHEADVAKSAALATEEQMVRDLKLLLSCQQVQEQKK